MLKKRISYTDYNGVTKEKDFYFNLSEAELTEMQLEQGGGFDAMLQRIVDSKDIPGLTKVFKQLIIRAYGEKSADGKYFRKSADISEKFLSTEAYSKLYMELISDPDKMADFITGLLPKSVQGEVAKQKANGELKVVSAE